MGRAPFDKLKAGLLPAAARSNHRIKIDLGCPAFAMQDFAFENSRARAYRLDFSVNEMEDGKKINTRQYSMNLDADDSNEINIGTRVPIEGKQGQFEYLDVGTKIWCRLAERANGMQISVRAEISNFAMPDQQAQQSRPVLRQLSIRASTVAQLGKPMVVGSVDDPNSKRQFQLEVTVTKLK